MSLSRGPLPSQADALPLLFGGVSLGLFTGIGGFAVYGPSGAPWLASVLAMAMALTAAWGFLKSAKEPQKLGEQGHEEVVVRPKKSAAHGSQPRPAAVVVVDPFSTGAVLAQMAADRGYQVVRVVSGDVSEELLHMLPAACRNLSFAATIQHEGDVQATVRRIGELDLDIQAFTVGCESGVEFFDAVSSAFGGPIKSNGCELSSARRDKYLMGERVRAAGLRAAKQVETSQWEDVEGFVQELMGGRGWEGLELVLKPVRSAGTEDVFFVDSRESARTAFDTIIGKTNLFGEVNASVLVQEFLCGKEYVVDCVSKDGEHKVVAIWEYDKRQANGSRFTYFGVNLFESLDGRREQVMAQYIFGVLDALGVRHGPSHAEVMWLEREDRPCLVEVGARPHGGEGTFTELSTPGIGYNQLTVILDALEDNGRFEQLPTRPGRLHAHATEVTLVSWVEGELLSFENLEEIRGLRSFKSIELKMKPGDRVRRTTDFLTSPGSVMLVHPDPAVVRADAEFIHDMSRQGRLLKVAA